MFRDCLGYQRGLLPTLASASAIYVELNLAVGLIVGASDRPDLLWRRTTGLRGSYRRPCLTVAVTYSYWAEVP